MSAHLMSHEEIFQELRPQLSADAENWLRKVRKDLRSDLRGVRTVFPAVGRHCGRAPLTDAPEELRGWTVDDATRVVILGKLRTLWELQGFNDEVFLRELEELYQTGDAAERRAVLLSLPYIFKGDDAVSLVQDALRTNDTRLVRAALGPYARDHLIDHDYRQAILKCIFVGVPLEGVSGLAERADTELATMLAAYAHERLAAGRVIPADVWLVLDRFPDVITESDLSASRS